MAASQVVTTETLNFAKSFGEGSRKLDVGANDWAEEVDNEVEMGVAAGLERSRTPSPTWWVAAGENEREARMAARLLADVEEREKRLAVKLLAMEGIETELTQKGR